MQNQIIYCLKKSQGYLSGEELSRHLKMSRAAIWKHIQEMREQGYDIAAVPHLGYQLVSCPDKLLPREIEFNLGTKIFGRKIWYQETMPSTMDAAFQLGMKGIAEGAVVCAETQTKGRGRLGRGWSSPKGKGIYCSILLRPSLPPSNAAHLTLMAGVALCETVKKMTGLSATIKWPNDVLIRDKKLAGILTEMSAEMDRVRFVVVGLGINVNTPLSALPPQAASLKHELGRAVPRVELLQEILRSFESWYTRLKQNGSAPMIRRWRELSSTLGHRICLTDAQGALEGEAVDVDESGGLIVRSDAGIHVRRMTGDVMVVR